jgi:hypothetical protein
MSILNYCIRHMEYLSSIYILYFPFSCRKTDRSLQTMVGREYFYTSGYYCLNITIFFIRHTYDNVKIMTK